MRTRGRSLTRPNGSGERFTSKIISHELVFVCWIIGLYHFI